MFADELTAKKSIYQISIVWVIIYLSQNSKIRWNMEVVLNE